MELVIYNVSPVCTIVHDSFHLIIIFDLFGIYLIISVNFNGIYFVTSVHFNGTQ